MSSTFILNRCEKCDHKWTGLRSIFNAGKSQCPKCTGKQVVNCGGVGTGDIHDAPIPNPKTLQQPPTRGKQPAAKKVKLEQSVAKTQRSGKINILDAAATVLKDLGKMTAKELVKEMERRDIWSSPNGKTPDATLAARLYVAINTGDKRFVKVGPGTFALTQ